MKRLLLIMLAAALLMPGLVSASQLAQRRALRDGLAAAGCFGIATAQQVIGSQATFAVSVSECRDDSGVDLPAGPALEKIADVVWLSPAVSFNMVSATIYRSQDSPSARSRTFTSAELESRRGPRSPDLDWVLPDLIRGGWFGYLAPLAILMVLAVPVGLGVLAARRGVLVLFWRL